MSLKTRLVIAHGQSITALSDKSGSPARSIVPTAERPASPQCSGGTDPGRARPPELADHGRRYTANGSIAARSAASRGFGGVPVCCCRCPADRGWPARPQISGSQVTVADPPPLGDRSSRHTSGRGGDTTALSADRLPRSLGGSVTQRLGIVGLSGLCTGAGGLVCIFVCGWRTAQAGRVQLAPDQLVGADRGRDDHVACLSDRRNWYSLTQRHWHAHETTYIYQG